MLHFLNRPFVYLLLAVLVLCMYYRVTVYQTDELSAAVKEAEKSAGEMFQDILFQTSLFVL